MMTWSEIRQLHPWLPESSEGWHQHENGSGWVRDGVDVPHNIVVGPKAVIGGGAIRGGTIRGGMIWGGTIEGGTINGGTINGGTIRGGTILDGTIWGGTILDGTIWGGTIWGGTILGGTIRGGTILDGTIWGGTIRGGTIWDGTIRGGTIEGGTIRGGTIEGGTIRGGTITFSPLLIFGSRYFVGYAGDGLVASGCIVKPLAWWLENVERCAEVHGYTPTEQREYRMHIEHVAAWMRLHGLDKEGRGSGGKG